MIAFLNFNFLFFILFFPYFFFFFIHISFFFSPFFFSFTHVLLLFSFFPSFLFFPYHFLRTPKHFTELSFFLFLFLFSFFLSLFSLTTLFASFFPSIPSKHTNLKVTHNHTIWFSSNEDRERVKSPREENCIHRLLICSAFTTACLPPDRCLFSSPLPTTCNRNGSDRFFFFLVLISLLGSFVKLCYKQRDKIGFLRIKSGQFGKFAQLPTVKWNALQRFSIMELLIAFAIWDFPS